MTSHSPPPECSSSSKSHLKKFKQLFKRSSKKPDTSTTSSEDSPIAMSSKAIRKRERATTTKKSRTEEQSSTSSPQITDVCSTSPEDSPVSMASRPSNKRLKHSPSRRSQRQAEMEEERLAKIHERQRREALNNLQHWTWEAATSRPPRPHTPELGPMDEDPCYDDPISTGYQGLPEELCDHIRDMKANTAVRFERVYREEKNRELRGAGSAVSAEQLFLEKVENYKQRELHRQARAELRARDLEHAQQPDAEVKAYVDERRDFDGAEQSIWSRRERNGEGDYWPKWGEEQLEVVDRAPAESNGWPTSFDLVSPNSQDSGYIADLNHLEIEVHDRPESINVTPVPRDFLLSPEEDALAIKIVARATIPAYPYHIEYEKATTGNSPQNPIVVRG